MEAYSTNDPDGAGMIVYGLGNLFFDQMQIWATRTELIAHHTIYQGRVINTEILTAVLEDYAQPRWATAEERSGILTRIFNAVPPTRNNSRTSSLFVHHHRRITLAIWPQ